MLTVKWIKARLVDEEERAVAPQPGEGHPAPRGSEAADRGAIASDFD